jgi:hypothetical protein
MAPLDELLLAEAREAQAASTHAQAQADLARLRYQHALRRLYQAGASTREIARAFELSHQRVHQLVDRRTWACSFCATTQHSGAILIAGPGVKICHDCVALASGGRQPFRLLTTARRRPQPTCSFCGKARSEVEAMAEEGGSRVCSDCLALCREIVAEKLGPGN